MKSGYKMYNQAQLEKAIREESQKIALQMRDDIWDKEKDGICAQVFAEICYVLHTEFDFGEVRLKRLQKAVDVFNVFLCNGFAGKQFDTMDCVEWLKKYAGIDVMKDVGD